MAVPWLSTAGGFYSKRKMKLPDIHIRDPFVLPVLSERRYYLYGTMGEYAWGETGVGFDCYRSADLHTWEGPFPVFRPPAGFWADRNFWAPEVHAYGGRYFLFASFKAEGVCRGMQILAAESPLGPFCPVSAGPVTPTEWECLDGTLLVDADGSPWMVFCHEWVQVGDGEICALPLSKDLALAAGEPVVLFCASQAPWVQFQCGWLHHRCGAFCVGTVAWSLAARHPASVQQRWRSLHDFS